MFTFTCSCCPCHSLNKFMCFVYYKLRKSSEIRKWIKAEKQSIDWILESMNKKMKKTYVEVPWIQTGYVFGILEKLEAPRSSSLLNYETASTRRHQEDSSKKQFSYVVMHSHRQTKLPYEGMCVETHLALFRFKDYDVMRITVLVTMMVTVWYSLQENSLKDSFNWRRKYNVKKSSVQ